MSANPPKHYSEHRGSAEQNTGRNPVPSELESVNIRLARLRDSVLPASPYLLTVPTDIPFRLGSRFVNNWAVGKKGPFAAEEQQLQYMTFLMHHDTDSLLVAVGDWSDNNGGIMAKPGDKSSNVSGAASTPTTNGVAKKKISLSDYKTKAEKESVRNTPEKSQQPPKDGTKQDRSKAPPAPTTKERPMLDPPAEKVPKRESGSKRSLGVSLEKSADAPAPKRMRTSPSQTSRPSDASSKSQSSSKKIPALLSPTLPPTSSDSRLPELLSPTLPPLLEEELAQIEDDSHASKPSVHRRDISAVSNKSRDGILPAKLPDQNKSQLEPKTISKHSQKEPQSRLSSSGLPAKVNLSHRDTDPDTVSLHDEKSPPKAAKLKRNGSSSTENTAPQRLIVKLRYGRANRRRVEALLKFVGKRKVSDNKPQKPINEFYSEDEDSDLRKTEAKHREKRQKHSHDEDYKETPSVAFKTVASEKSHSALKSSSHAAKTTPVKDSRGNSHRGDSREADVRTPLSLSSTKGVTNSIEKTTKMPSSHADAPTISRDDEWRAWREEFQKYTALGRQLKHIADRYTRAKASNENATVSDERVGAASGIEAILCFIVAFIADDRSKALARQVGDSDNWRSIIAYWKAVRVATKRYPHLRGLCLILGAVSHDAINSLDMERLAVCSMPGEQSPVPTPGSDENPLNSEKNKSHKKEFLELKTRLPENFREANRLWLEGCRELSDDVLAAEYPETWAKRSRNFAERGTNKLKAGRYAGEYFLPFGRTTTPMEAVRFGVALLQEWYKNEGLAFEPRLKLS
ncbi:hypothetical protein PISL3812_03720 [Talaromyces islandicus]|uniref:Ell binding protein Ebp1 C-terminal domain-containing protein n=1 Tax=Talaromyces islandicus TaxID=28573 RepID=A0A0U1LVV6_TALIS|nr:hypothetical protein PISL3812_03720 [Talaromyces islandicus]